MTLIRQYVSKLSLDVVKQIIRDHDQFEHDGSIGDCVLRKRAEELMAQLGIRQDVGIVIWMQHIATECWRRIALEHEPDMLQVRNG